jgi:hypothetical protein
MRLGCELFIFSMTPKGIFCFVSRDPYLVASLVPHINSLIDTQVEHFSFVHSADGLCILGAITSNTSYYPLVLESCAESNSVGVLDGIFFSPHAFYKRPSLISRFSKSCFGIPNGMFVGAGYSNGQLTILADPFSTIPLYYRKCRDGFIASSSLLLTTHFPSGFHSTFSFEGVCQFIQFGKILNGKTFYDDVFRVKGAEAVSYSLSINSLQKRRYWEPDISPTLASKNNILIDQTRESFYQAISRCLDAVSCRTTASLSGGLDSRTVLSVAALINSDITTTTYGMKSGYDVLFAARVARSIGLKNIFIEIGRSFNNSPLAFLSELESACNYCVHWSNAHLVIAYQAISKFSSIHIDGNHSFLESRLSLRNNGRFLRTQASFNNAIIKMLSRGRRMHWLPDHIAAIIRSQTRESISSIIPSVYEWPSPGIASDFFTIAEFLPVHGTDAACLQNQYCRYLTPYFDLDYISCISKVTESSRWDQTPQIDIMKKFNSGLLNIPRSYSDVYSPFITKPIISRIPVAWHRYGVPLAVKLLPDTLVTRFDPWRPSYDYSNLEQFLTMHTKNHLSLFTKALRLFCSSEPEPLPLGQLTSNDLTEAYSLLPILKIGSRD